MINQATIRRLVSRPDLIREFPFLQMTVTLPNICCGQPARQPNIHGIRGALGVMAPHRKLLFEKMSGVRVT